MVTRRFEIVLMRKNRYMTYSGHNRVRVDDSVGLAASDATQRTRERSKRNTELAAAPTIDANNAEQTGWSGRARELPTPTSGRAGVEWASVLPTPTRGRATPTSGRTGGVGERANYRRLLVRSLAREQPPFLARASAGDERVQEPGGARDATQRVQERVQESGGARDAT